MKNGMTIRNAEKEDVRQIAEILVEDWQKAYRGIIDSDFLDAMDVDQRYEIEVKRYQKFVVAADGNEILGYAWLEMAADKPADCEVIALYVRYSHRNNGIGKLLLRYAMKYFRGSGKKTMIISCLKENDEARRFYEKKRRRSISRQFSQMGKQGMRNYFLSVRSDKRIKSYRTENGG